MYIAISLYTYFILYILAVNLNTRFIYVVPIRRRNVQSQINSSVLERKQKINRYFIRFVSQRGYLHEFANLFQ